MYPVATELTERQSIALAWAAAQDRLNALYILLESAESLSDDESAAALASLTEALSALDSGRPPVI